MEDYEKKYIEAQERYLNERFIGMEKHFETMNAMLTEKLGQILAQTTKTNGSVAELKARVKLLEERQLTCPVAQMEKKIEKIEKNIENLNQETEIARFFQKYPKIAKAAILVFTFVGLIQTWLTIKTLLGK